mgnify:CR=1 FL=1
MNNINRLQRPVLLSTLWIVLTLNYLYCDVLGLTIRRTSLPFKTAHSEDCRSARVLLSPQAC